MKITPESYFKDGKVNFLLKGLKVLKHSETCIKQNLDIKEAYL
jgi:hypothetical protein